MRGTEIGGSVLPTLPQLPTLVVEPWRTRCSHGVTYKAPDFCAFTTRRNLENGSIGAYHSMCDGAHSWSSEYISLPYTGRRGASAQVAEKPDNPQHDKQEAEESPSIAAVVSVLVGIETNTVLVVGWARGGRGREAYHLPNDRGL